MIKRRIVYCIPGLYSSGGMERVLSIKANFLATHGYEVHIIITNGGDKAPAFPLDTSIQVHQLNIDFEEPYRYSFFRRVWMYKRRMKIFRKKLSACLNQIKPDITISMMSRDINLINRMKDGSIKIAEIHFGRQSYRHLNIPWLPRFVLRFIRYLWMRDLIAELKKLSRFVVLTHEDAVNWPELKNVIVMPNPASFFPEKQSDCMSKQIIAAGRYVPQKGFDLLIQAWSLIAAKHPDWKLKIYGDGWMRESMTQQILSLGLQESCFLEHTSHDIASEMLESSIFVLSSRFEGFALVLIEAMSCGIPVVSFACPCGSRDIVSEGNDGFLVQNGDIVSLSEKIEQLIVDKKLRQKMGQDARLKAKNYQIERIGMRWMELFEQLISEKNKA